MGPQTIHLPDGQTFTVTPVFAGLFFKSHELNTHHNIFPVGWTVVLRSEDTEKNDDAKKHNEDAKHEVQNNVRHGEAGRDEGQSHTRSWTEPTLQGDSLFISSISNPSSTDFKPPVSVTRQIAMMLWITLYWYFHQREPCTTLKSEASKFTPEGGKPKGEWRINIREDGVLRGRNLIPKLERMGLIASLDSSVGEEDGDGWSQMFVSRRMFWQLPGRLFLFTLQPNNKGSNFFSHPGTPTISRPTSPALSEHPPASPAALAVVHDSASTGGTNSTTPTVTLASMPSFPIGPFFSASHLPTYYPPAPVQYVTTNQIRHPLRPKPPRMGEVFYTRFVPSVGQYLSFRVASSSASPVPYLGPIGPNPPPSPATALTDTALLRVWMDSPRVQAFWGKWHARFLPDGLASRHSFPVIGLWDGVPFGYFEIYWVREDVLGRHLGGAGADDWDRGLHVFIGEDWARGRVQSWLTSLVHWAFCADYRTMSMCIEPRVDNARFIQHLQQAGFNKEKEISFPHKQSWFGRLRRDEWEGPAL